ncbi:MAG TPA: stalk domain-containing protein [Armatimonadota bacterium]
MHKRTFRMALLVATGVSLAGVSANAVVTTGEKPFVYLGRNYVPLKSTAGLLGAPVKQNTATGHTTIRYQGKDLVLTPNKTAAKYAGRSVKLPSPPVVVKGVTYVPVETFRKYYNVPVQWDKNKSVMKIKGSRGWRSMQVNNRPPWHGGPPPWAPAWGRRGYAPPGHSGYLKPGAGENGYPRSQRRVGAKAHPIYLKPGAGENGYPRSQRGVGAKGHPIYVRPGAGGNGNRRGQRDYGAPGNSGKDRPGARGNGNARGRRDDNSPGNSGKDRSDARGNGNGKGRRDDNSPGNSGDEKGNGNGKAKGNKDRG